MIFYINNTPYVSTLCIFIGNLDTNIIAWQYNIIFFYYQNDLRRKM